MELRHVRTILCVPGHREDFAATARNHGADQILWDLEDSVPEAQKERAREVVDQHLAEGDAIRINHPSSSHFDRDMEFVNMWAGVVWVPKCGDPVALCDVYDRRREMGAPAALSHVALLESPRAIASLDRFMGVPSLWAGLAFGRHDFVASAGLSYLQQPLIDHAALQVVLAARARGVPCWMAPSYERDPVMVMDEAEHAWDLGFTGMGCIRPSQVGLVRAAFQVADEDVARAGLLLEHARARPDEAVFETLDGDLVSPPTVKWAKGVLGG